MRRTPILVSVIAMILAGLLAVGRLPIAGAQEEPSTAGHPLVGSWLVGVKLEGQAPGAPLPSELTSLITYFADGKVLVANAGQLPPLPPGSGLFFTEGHGQWVATGAPRRKPASSPSSSTRREVSPAPTPRTQPSRSMRRVMPTPGHPPSSQPVRPARRWGHSRSRSRPRAFRWSRTRLPRGDSRSTGYRDAMGRET